jgi:hypothetical protein
MPEIQGNWLHAHIEKRYPAHHPDTGCCKRKRNSTFLPCGKEIVLFIKQLRIWQGDSRPGHIGTFRSHDEEDFCFYIH